MGLLTRGAAFLNRALGAAAGVTLTYTRGVTTASVTGWAGQEGRDATESPTPGVRRDDRERDFLFAYADLVTAGFGEPQEGDRITETLNSAAVVWKVLPRDTEPAWRWSDLTKTRVRVHTERA